MTVEGEPEKPDDTDPEDKTPADWDSSWNEYQRKSVNGGVFELPKEDADQKQGDLEDERVGKLTSVWSNETGFLIGIAVIGLIALFYGYVYLTGGISHS